MKKNVTVVGAGLAGATAARMLAEAGYNVSILEASNNVGGMCYDFVHEKTGQIVQEFGPHTCHSQCEEVWNFWSRFTEWREYVNLTYSYYEGEYYTWPLNLRTISKFFKQDIYSAEEARALIEADKKKMKITDPKNFEEAVIADIGPSLYYAFFEDYTRRQWQCDPKELPTSLYGRVKVKFNFNDAVYNNEFQGMPVNGYTEMIKKMIDHENITSLKLNHTFDLDGQSDDVIFFSGYIGSAPMRKLKFHHTIEGKPEKPVVTLARDEKFTRVTCPAIMYGQHNDRNEYAVCREEPVALDAEGLASYPLEQYRSLYESEAASTLRRFPNMVLIGRLALYKYYDMWMAVRSTMDIVNEWIKKDGI